MTILLDSNVLVSLVVADHIYHDPAETWLAAAQEAFATCPITQGSLVRRSARHGQPAATAGVIVDSIMGDPRHEFCPDSVSFASVQLAGVVSHRQVTATYLVQLARAHHGRLATFDRGLAQLHSDVAELVAAP
ncbi:MAG: TA system VapC family ribonuclease toxin [Mycobacterium sp.]